MPTSTLLEQVRKRDGRIVAFDRAKIAAAILKAAQAVQGGDPHLAETLSDEVTERLLAVAEDDLPTVEQIQDAIERVLIEGGHARTAKAFILYRERRSRIRDAKTELMVAVEEILGEGDRPDARHASPSEKMLRIGATASKEYYLKRVLPEEMAVAHVRGDFHIQDLEHYAKAPNSFILPLDRMLQQGFKTEHGTVRGARRPQSAAALAAIALQAAQNDCFGGQGFDRFDTAIAAITPDGTTDAELRQAMEALVFDLNLLQSRQGGQVPYSTLSFGDDPDPVACRVSFALLDAFERGLGRGEPAIYPNLVFRHRAGVSAEPGDPNYDLLQRACEVAARRMQPTFAFLDAPGNRGADVAYLSGCARVAPDRHGAPVAGRGAIATVTLNLARVALRAKRDRADVLPLLERQTRLALRSLLHRYSGLTRLKVGELPFVMGEHLYAGSEALSADDEVAPALRHGQLALGFVGLAEALNVLAGAHHGESDAAQDLGLTLISRMREWVDAASEEHDLNLVLYGQHTDRGASRFPLLDRRDFGEVDGVTDRDYYTNAFGVPGGFEMTAERRIAVEAPYHALCNGGHLTTLEWATPGTGAGAARIVSLLARAGAGLGGLNFPLDHCAACGRTGAIAERCPECGATGGMIRRVRRLAGYLSPVERFSPGRFAELAARRPVL
jgi:ribonucleoside-triphosphate reductase